MAPLLGVLIAVMWTLGMNLGGPGVHDLLHPWSMWWAMDLWPVKHSSYLGIDTPNLPGVELIAVPLAAIAAANLRPGAERITLLREGSFRQFLPALMAASLVGVTAYLVWSWGLPQADFGPDEFGFVRWLGTALLASFTWFWWPVFPRVTAKLAGMIGGPALFAGIGYLLYADVIKNEPTGYCEGGCAFGVMLTLCAVFVLELCLKLSKRLWLSPVAHAVWTSGLMAAVAALGTTMPV